MTGLRTEVSRPLVWGFVFIWLFVIVCYSVVGSNSLVCAPRSSLGFPRDFSRRAWDVAFPRHQLQEQCLLLGFCFSGLPFCLSLHIWGKQFSLCPWFSEGSKKSCLFSVCSCAKSFQLFLVSTEVTTSKPLPYWIRVEVVFEDSSARCSQGFINLKFESQIKILELNQTLKVVIRMVSIFKVSFVIYTEEEML